MRAFNFLVASDPLQTIVFYVPVASVQEPAIFRSFRSVRTIHWYACTFF